MHPDVRSRGLVRARAEEHGTHAGVGTSAVCSAHTGTALHPRTLLTRPRLSRRCLFIPPEVAQGALHRALLRAEDHHERGALV